MANRRLLRVADQLREELADIIRMHVHDPRVTGHDFTILRVDVSPDLAHARVHVSTLLPSPRREELIAGMNHAAGYMHRELMTRLRLKTVPALTFAYDEGLAASQRIADILQELKRGA
jgi:ribosome-binding factor A